jgi:hypothetical protein
LSELFGYTKLDIYYGEAFEKERQIDGRGENQR